MRYKRLCWRYLTNLSLQYHRCADHDVSSTCLEAVHPSMRDTSVDPSGLSVLRVIRIFGPGGSGRRCIVVSGRYLLACGKEWSYSSCGQAPATGECRALIFGEKRISNSHSASFSIPRWPDDEASPSGTHDSSSIFVTLHPVRAGFLKSGRPTPRSRIIKLVVDGGSFENCHKLHIPVIIFNPEEDLHIHMPHRFTAHTWLVYSTARLITFSSLGISRVTLKVSRIYQSRYIVGCVIVLRRYALWRALRLSRRPRRPRRDRSMHMLCLVPARPGKPW